MTRKEALNKYADKIKTKDELVNYCNIVNKIYDDFENRTCETCSKNIAFECEIFNKLQFGHNEFGCNKWSERK
jgi:hypothetical protein